MLTPRALIYCIENIENICAKKDFSTNIFATMSEAVFSKKEKKQNFFFPFFPLSAIYLVGGISQESLSGHI